MIGITYSAGGKIFSNISVSVRKPLPFNYTHYAVTSLIYIYIYDDDDDDNNNNNSYRYVHCVLDRSYLQRKCAW